MTGDVWFLRHPVIAEIPYMYHVLDLINVFCVHDLQSTRKLSARITIQWQ